jgi:hypothetical protein
MAEAEPGSPGRGLAESGRWKAQSFLLRKEREVFDAELVGAVQAPSRIENG